MADPRPPVWIGHVTMSVPDVTASGAFMARLGMRVVFQSSEIGIYELRGGTHLLLFPRQDPVPADARAPFDLMVEDVDDARRDFEARGLAPGTIERNPHHRCFTVREPGGHAITINSSHVEGPV